jgi:hypothetical protein
MRSLAVVPALDEVEDGPASISTRIARIGAAASSVVTASSGRRARPRAALRRAYPPAPSCSTWLAMEK